MTVELAHPEGVSSAACNHRPAWAAELELAFQRAPARTVIGRRRHRGPLLVQSPFYPEGGVCHTYILHPPGGIAGGDVLRLDLAAGAGTHALATTPAAGKFYRCADNPSRQQVNIRIEEDAGLEWLPQENILFDGAHTRLDLDIDLVGNARIFAWDMLCLGRPQCGERFTRGRLRSAVRLSRQGRPLLIETLDVGSAGAFAGAQWGLAGQAVVGTLLAAPGSCAMYEAALAVQRQSKLERASVTHLRDVLVCRYLGPNCAQLREFFVRVWSVLRPLWTGLAPCPPRIWAS